MSKKYTTGPLLKEPQEIFEEIRHNWSTLIAIEGPGTMLDTGYHGKMGPPPPAYNHPAIVIRTGYAEIRAVFILKKNILEYEWPSVAMEAMSRPECSLGAAPEGIASKKAIKIIYKGITNISEYPFPKLVPAFCLEEMYEKIEFVCGRPGPCQKELKKVAGNEGSLCMPGDKINYSICTAMPCNCSTAQEYHSTVMALEKIVPTRHQLMLMQKFDNEETTIDTTDIIRTRRSEAAKKGWDKRRTKAVAEASNKVE